MLRVKQGVYELSRAKSGPCVGRRMQISLRRPFRTGKSCNGDSETELTERYPGAGGEVTGRFGNVFNPSETHDAHRKSAQGRHHVWPVFCKYLGEVFVVCGIADMMVTVFNLPMAAGYTQQVFWSRPIFGQAGEAEGAIITDISAFHVDGDALDPEGLTQMWEVYARCPGGDGNFAVFKTAMTDASRFSAEGGNPPKGGISGCCGVFADCL
ncbi:hypothetical protein JKG47_19495 [Acidithiobacillus sp. MC6.1]|nr:hypothetical protein [Acidithiobacillus sp. MC6.1]